jgi:hypothetical protein
VSADSSDPKKPSVILRKRGEPLPDGVSKEQAKVIEKAAPVVNHQVGGDFTKVEGSERRRILLRAAPHATQPSMLWTKDRKFTRRFFVRKYLEYIDEFQCEFTDRAAKVMGEVDKELDLVGGNDIYFNIRCEESSLFFHLPRRALASRHGFLHFKIPAVLFEVQRRAQLRYRTSSSDEFSIQSEVPALRGRLVSVLDVSSGGVGFKTTFEDGADAATFDLLPEQRIHFHLNLDAFSMIVEGEVRYVKRETDVVSDMPTARVGIRFVGLPQDAVEALQLFVMERSYVRLRNMFDDG